MRRCLSGLLLGFALLAAACGGDSSGSTDSTPTAVAGAAATITAAPTSSSPRAPELDDSAALPGMYVPPHPGPDGRLGTSDDRQHFANGTVVPICTAQQIASNGGSNPLCYTSNPPTSGPHAVSPMPFRFLDGPGLKENLIHNMEHAGVVIWYNTTNAAVIDQIRTLENSALDRRLLVVASAYVDMEPETIALTAWTRLDKFPVSQLTDKRVNDFIAAHVRRYNPEGF